MKLQIKNLIKNKKPLLWGLGLLAVVALFLGGNLISLAHNHVEKRKLVRQNTQLDAQYQKLLHTKQRLEEDDPALLEEIARTQYDLAKPNEVEFRFSDK